jgi:hypothetical protein
MDAVTVVGFRIQGVRETGAGVFVVEPARILMDMVTLYECYSDGTCQAVSDASVGETQSLVVLGESLAATHHVPLTNDVVLEN